MCRTGVLCHVERVLVAHIDHCRADLDPAGARANCRQQRERRSQLPRENGARGSTRLLAFRLAVCSDPDSEWGCYGLGNALAALDQHQEAADAYKRAIQLNQKDRAVPFRPTGDTWFRLGCSLEVLGLDDEATRALAEGDCRTLPRLALSNASFQYVAWGQDLEAECRYESALYAFDQAIQRNPRSLRAHCGLGRVLAALGRDGEALESFDQAVDRHPHCRLAHHCRAKALDRLGRREEADEAYKRAKTTRESESPHQQEIQSPS
jgi:tetratricopeptide (TPR) repeat protein